MLCADSAMDSVRVAGSKVLLPNTGGRKQRSVSSRQEVALWDLVAQAVAQMGNFGGEAGQSLRFGVGDLIEGYMPRQRGSGNLQKASVWIARGGKTLTWRIEGFCMERVEAPSTSDKTDIKYFH